MRSISEIRREQTNAKVDDYQACAYKQTIVFIPSKHTCDSVLIKNYVSINVQVLHNKIMLVLITMQL